MSKHVLDQKSYDALELKLVELKKRLKGINVRRGEVAGSIRHDNDKLEIERSENILIQMIEEIEEQLKNATILDPEENEEVVGLNDIIDITLIGAGVGNMTVRLVAYPSLDSEVPEISVNSVIGSALLGAHLGKEISYGQNNIVIVNAKRSRQLGK